MTPQSRVTGLAATAALVGAAVFAAPAVSATAMPSRDGAAPSAYACPDSVKVTADWLKVHTSPGLSTPVVGQLPKGATFCLLSRNYPYADGYFWAHGYGYNGSTKLTGHVVSRYLTSL